MATLSYVFMKCLAPMVVENVEVIGMWHCSGYLVISELPVWLMNMRISRLTSGTSFPLYFKISPEHASETMFNEGSKCLKSLPGIWNGFENHEQGPCVAYSEITWWHSFLLFIWHSGVWAGYLGMVNLIMYLPVLAGNTLGACKSTASAAREKFQAEEVGTNWTEASPGLGPGQQLILF